MEIDVCVIGLGRVGLPFALFLADKGLKVAGIDKNTDLMMNQLPEKKMPFKEKGCQEILERVNITLSTGYGIIKHSKNVVITVGTPIKQDREINLGHIKSVIDEMLPFIEFRKEHKLNIILRSTVEPGTTSKIIEYIEHEKNMKCGTDFTLCFCPERLVEGKALEEIESIPNIIGVDDMKSYVVTKTLMEKLDLQSLKATIIEAELSKCFLNMYRYARFGIVNYLSVVAEMHSCNIHDVLDIANYNYPRGIKEKVGFAGGPCLTKDWRMFNANMPFADFFQSIGNINQNFFDVFLYNALSYLPKETRIGILGYTFKRNSDDIRDSNVPKIVRRIEGNFFKNIMISDYNITAKDLELDHRKYWTSQDVVVEKSDLLIIAMNHERYEHIEFKNDYILDVWNVTKKNKIYQINIMDD